MLAQSEVIPYLIERELLRSKSVVQENLLLIDTSRRNRNFQVISESGRSYFIKQGIGSSGRTTVAHEAVVYEFLEAHLHRDERTFLPGYIGYDADAGLLILELVPRAQDLREYHEAGRHSSTRIAGHVGAALATIHRVPLVVEGGRGSDHALGGGAPGVLSIHHPGLSVVHEISNGNLEMTKLIQRSEGFPDLLDQLRAEWRTEALVHNDMRWDNCLVYLPDERSPRKTRVKVIDWELAGHGDTAADVGAFISNYLVFWLASIPMSQDDPSVEIVASAEYPIERMQRAIQSFWASYLQVLQVDSGASGQLLLRAVKHSAARLVQAAYEHLRRSVSLSETALRLLQLSENILRRPEEAVVHLLRLPL